MVARSGGRDAVVGNVTAYRGCDRNDVRRRLGYPGALYR